MRSDADGLFWQDAPPSRSTRHAGNRPPPPVPETGWAPPTEFPRLEAAREIVIDVETYDPQLKTHGPGWATGNGHIVGLAVGTRDARWYFPIQHEHGGGNLDGAAVLRWAADELGRDSQPKIGANLLYDCGWLRHSGVRVAGSLVDVLYAEPLLNEHRQSFALGSLAGYYGLDGKAEEPLYRWLAAACGGPATRSAQAGNIYRAPAKLVGPYAESDVRLPLEVYERQRPLLERQRLLELFEMECGLIPLLLDMRMQGVRVDVQKAERVREEFLQREQAMRHELARLSGRKGFDPNIRDDMVAAFNKCGLAFPTTAKGTPSFTKPFLQSIQHPLPEAILELRRLEKARGTFIEGYILDKHHNGRIHCQFHPLKADENGTVSGRFSSSSPNLQNIPSRDKEMRRLVRGCFLPEEGEQWFAPDYSQIEYRLMVHAASGAGAEEARRLFNEDPSTDYHAFTGDLVNDILGVRLDRKPVKNINFGKIFGMGKDKLLAMLNMMSPEQAEQFFEAYDEAIPYAKTTAEKAAARAQQRGFIRTVLGRRSRFPFWEARRWEDRVEVSLDKDYIVEQYGSAVRAHTHKALNAYTQGSAADIIKKAMLAIYEAGLPIPLVQVHDELGFSMCPGAQANEILDLMQGAVKLKVPLLVDASWGPNWGEAK